MKSCLVVLGVVLILVALAGCAVAIAFFVMASRRKQRQQAAVAPPPPPPPVAPRPEPQPIDPAATVAVPLAGLKTPAIVFTSGPLAGQRFEVTQRGFWIGRDAPSEVLIPAPSVSRRHTFVGLRDGRPVVLDDGSTNGTFLQQKERKRITEHFLAEGDVVVIADDAAVFRFESA